MTGQWLKQQAGFPCQMLQGVVELPLINIPQFSLMSPEQLWGLSRLFPEIKHSRAKIHVNCLCSKAIHFWCSVVLLSICVSLHLCHLSSGHIHIELVQILCFCRRCVTQFCKLRSGNRLSLLAKMVASRVSLTWPTVHADIFQVITGEVKAS